MAESMKTGGRGPSKPPKPGQRAPAKKERSGSKSQVPLKEIGLIVVILAAIAWLIFYIVRLMPR